VIHMRLVEDCSFAADELLQRVIDLLCCCGDQRGLRSKIEKRVVEVQMGGVLCRILL